MENLLTWAEIVLPSRGKCVDVSGDCIVSEWELCLTEVFHLQRSECASLLSLYDGYSV